MRVLPSLIVLSALLLCAASAFYGVKLGGFDVVDQQGDFVLTWTMDLEEDVRSYDVQRRTRYSNNEFVSIQNIPAHGPKKAYRFRDDQVYKSAIEQVDYRLEVVYNNGLREVLVTKSMNYTPTAVRRTWGSIKAMFQ